MAKVLTKAKQKVRVYHAEETASVYPLSSFQQLSCALSSIELVKLFRPDREGNLTMVDFVRSIDSVYRTYRLLIASIDNSGQIDRAFENIINTIFYTVVITVVLSLLG